MAEKTGGRTDRRVRKTKKLLLEGLMTLMQEKDIISIENEYLAVKARRTGGAERRRARRFPYYITGRGGCKSG